MNVEKNENLQLSQKFRAIAINFTLRTDPLSKILLQ